LRLLLAIDTASPDGIALACRPRTGGQPRVLVADEPRDHSRQLIPAVDELIAGRRRDIAAIGVCTGPGSYAGLRVGIATAESLAFALGVPVFGFGTFEAISLAAGRDCLAVHPAGREEFGARPFQGGRPFGPPRLVRAAELRAATALAGEGAATLGGREVGRGERVLAILEATAARLDAGQPPAGLEAFYLREPNITRPRRTPLRAAGQPQESN